MVGPLVVGAAGAYRLVSPFGSPRAAAIAAVAYAANPLPVSAIASGRWEALVIWGGAPFLLGSALRLQGVAPHAVADRPLSARLLRFGLLTAALATFVPVTPVLAIGLLAALALASVVVARPVGLGALLGGALAAVVVPLALHVPWSFAVLRRWSWSWLVGPSSPEQEFDSLADLVRFAPGRFAPGVLVIGLLGAAVVGLVIGRGRRFDGAARGWVIALVAWSVPWVDRRDWISIDGPAAETVLAFAAAGLALAVGCSVRALEVDASARPSIIRVGAVAALALGVGAVSLAGVRASFDGRWEQPRQAYGELTPRLAAQVGEPARILWLGDPSVLPVDGQTSAAGVSYAVTDGAGPDVVGRYAPPDQGMAAELGVRLDLAIDDQTVHVGRLLAPYGIDLLIVVPQLAPAPYDGPTRTPGAGIERVLDGQLDLQRLAGTPDLAVYRNQEARGPAIGLGESGREAVDAVIGASPLEQLGNDVTVAERSSLLRIDRSSWAGAAETAGDVVLAVPGSTWDATTDATRVRLSAADTLVLERTGDGPLGAAHHTSTLERLARVAQLLLIAAALLLAQTRRDEVPS